MTKNFLNSPPPKGYFFACKILNADATKKKTALILIVGVV